MKRSPVEEAYFRLLVDRNLECDHPPEFHHVPFYIDDITKLGRRDPNEWECGVCGTMQVRRPAREYPTGPKEGDNPDCQHEWTTSGGMRRCLRCRAWDLNEEPPSAYMWVRSGMVPHAKPIAKTRRGHLMNVDWTFGPETWVVEYSCSRCGQWLATAAADLTLGY